MTPNKTEPHLDVFLEIINNISAVKSTMYGRMLGSLFNVCNIAAVCMANADNVDDVISTIMEDLTATLATAYVAIIKGPGDWPDFVEEVIKELMVDLGTLMHKKEEMERSLR